MAVVQRDTQELEVKASYPKVFEPRILNKTSPYSTWASGGLVECPPGDTVRAAKVTGGFPTLWALPVASVTMSMIGKR